MVNGRLRRVDNERTRRLVGLQLSEGIPACVRSAHRVVRNCETRARRRSALGVALRLLRSVAVGSVNVNCYVVCFLAAFIRGSVHRVIVLVSSRVRVVLIHLNDLRCRFRLFLRVFLHRSFFRLYLVVF